MLSASLPAGELSFTKDSDAKVAKRPAGSAVLSVLARSRQVEREAHIVRPRSKSSAHGHGALIGEDLAAAGSDGSQEAEGRRRPSNIASAFGAGLRGPKGRQRHKPSQTDASKTLQPTFTFRQGAIRGVVRRDRGSASRRDTKGCPQTFLDTVRSLATSLTDHNRHRHIPRQRPHLPPLHCDRHLVTSPPRHTSYPHPLSRPPHLPYPYPSHLP